VIQAHRAVRGVFALEAPSAPDGVLERALASRARGELILLPSGDADAAPGIAVPWRILTIAAGLILSVVAAIQVVPISAVKSAWGRWAATVGEWQPLGDFSLNHLPTIAAPVAKPATLDPSRLREFTAEYVVGSSAPRNDTKMRIELRRTDEGWRVREWYIRPTRDGSSIRTTLSQESWLDSVTLATVRYRSFHSLTEDSLPIFISDATLNDSAAFVLNHWVGSAPVGKLNARTFKQGAWRVPVDYHYKHSRFFGDGGNITHVAATELRPGWVGSFTRLTRIYERSAYEYPPQSYLVTGDTTINTLGGPFDTWQLKPIGDWGTWFNVRKSDGLIVRAHSPQREGNEELYLLESVRYP
jgi:hypothetical protein